MHGLWLRLLRGSGLSARLEMAIPFVASSVITVILLLLIGLQQGLDHRGDRTAWRTPEIAQAGPTVIQAGFTDYVAARPIAVIELAALAPDPPSVPGMDRFPSPGEVWVSPALAELIATLPVDQLAARFPGRITAELAPTLLESPDELVAVIGRSPMDPAMTGTRPKHQWNDAASLSPTQINRWTTSPDLYQTTYRDLALLAVVFTTLPLVGLGDLASRLMAARRQRRIATLRLLGASTTQVIRLSMTELVLFSSIGALFGVLIHRLLLPTFAEVPIKGGSWFRADVELGTLLTLATAIVVVAVLTMGALTGLVPAVRNPLAIYRRTHPDTPTPRLLSVVLIAAAVLLFWVRSSNPFVSIAFTVVVILGWGLVATGPWVIGRLGSMMAIRASHPATFLAGRRLSASPRSAWRTVGGMALAFFLAGYVAASLPVGLGAAGDYASRADRLDIVVPASAVADTARQIDTALMQQGIQADVAVSEAPSWLDADAWGSIAMTISGAGAEQDRARTALIQNDLWGPELRLSDDLPVVWLLRDGITLGLLVLPIAVFVALTSMVTGAIARLFDQRESLIALTLVGSGQSVLLSAVRREIIVPTAVLGGLATVTGLACGSTLGLTNPFNPYSIGIVTGLLALGAGGMHLADRSVRPVMARVSTDLAERE